MSHDAAENLNRVIKCFGAANISVSIIAAIEGLVHKQNSKLSFPS